MRQKDYDIAGINGLFYFNHILGAKILSNDDGKPIEKPIIKAISKKIIGKEAPTAAKDSLPR